jgi:branched-chain amino acid transport system permease protein
VRLAIFALALAALAAAPWLLTRDLVTALLFTLVLVVMASNYDLLGGYLGLHNLGQATFFGLGAYVAFLLLLRVPGFLEAGPAGSAAAVLLGGVAASAFAALAAYPLLRLRGAYFAVGTFAMLLMIRLLVDNLHPVTGGAHGLYIPAAHYLELRWAYLLLLALAAASLAVNQGVAGSRLGMAMTAIRESEAAAAAVGIHAFRVRQAALVLGAFPTGLAGGIFGLYSGYIDVAVVLSIERSLFPVIAAMIGGTGLVWGPVVGASILRAIDVTLKNYLQLPVPAVAVYGVILVVIALAMPKGIVSALRAPFRRPPPPSARAGVAAGEHA